MAAATKRVEAERKAARQAEERARADEETAAAIAARMLAERKAIEEAEARKAG